MINCTVKLKPTPRQARQLSRWLWHLTGVWNWAVRKIEQDAAEKVYHSAFDLKALLKGHSFKMGIPASVLHQTATDAHLAWSDCFSGLRRQPRMKGSRNRLNSLVFRDGRYIAVGARRINVSGGIGSLAFHKQAIPAGKIKRMRVMRRASGWYGVITIDAGCFEAALKAVRTYGGVLEHPAASSAWAAFGLIAPPRAGGWVVADWHGGWTCCVDQGHYGHRAQKATWLYAVGVPLPLLKWGKSDRRVRFEDSYHSREERRRKIRTGTCQRLSKRERSETPAEFRDLLIEIARGSK